jgi:hypothetical protein
MDDACPRDPPSVLASGLSPRTAHLSLASHCVCEWAASNFNGHVLGSSRGFCYVTDDPAKTPSTFAAPVSPADTAVRIISKKPRDGLWHSACVAVSPLRFDSSLAAPSATCIASSEAAPCGDQHVLDPPASLP